jgi:RNA polymerase sigma factor (sigma-70 family)
MVGSFPPVSTAVGRRPMSAQANPEAHSRRLWANSPVADVWDMPPQPATAAPSISRMLPLPRKAPVRSAAVRGDGAAFAALYQREHQALYRYCRSIVRHDADARDALQTTMTKAFAALQREERDFELRPWLFRIAHNEAIAILRRRRPTGELDPALSLGGEPVAQAVEDRQRLAHLHGDLADLPERQRAALVLRELSGLGHREIAEVLECTTQAVKQAIFDARTGLQACEQGRSMRCDAVQRALSDGDGRRLSGRATRAHLRSCASCRRFRSALQRRPAELAALAPPLPIGAGTILLSHLLPGGKAASLAGGASAAASSGGVASVLATKAAVTVAVLATAGGATVVATRHAVARAPRALHATQHRAAGGASATTSVRLGGPAGPVSGRPRDGARRPVHVVRAESGASAAGTARRAAAAGGANRTAAPGGHGRRPPVAHGPATSRTGAAAHAPARRPANRAAAPPGPTRPSLPVPARRPSSAPAPASRGPSAPRSPSPAPRTPPTPGTGRPSAAAASPSDAAGSPGALSNTAPASPSRAPRH